MGDTRPGRSRSEAGRVSHQPKNLRSSSSRPYPAMWFSRFLFKCRIWYLSLELSSSSFRFWPSREDCLFALSSLLCLSFPRVARTSYSTSSTSQSLSSLMPACVCVCERERVGQQARSRTGGRSLRREFRVSLPPPDLLATFFSKRSNRSSASLARLSKASIDISFILPSRPPKRAHPDRRVSCSWKPAHPRSLKSWTEQGGSCFFPAKRSRGRPASRGRGAVARWQRCRGLGGPKGLRQK